MLSIHVDQGDAWYWLATHMVEGFEGSRPAPE